MEDVRENACHNADRANCEFVIGALGRLLKLWGGGRSRSLGHQLTMEKRLRFYFMVFSPNTLHEQD
jgi:hypothetical protein